MSIYVGVNNTAKSGRKMHVGVNGKASNVVEAYIGVGGVASRFYGRASEPEPEIPQPSDPLWAGVARPTSATAGDYAVICGGHNAAVSAQGIAYDSDFVRSQVPNLTKAASAKAGASAGGCALFAGGYTNTTDTSETNYVEVYNGSLTKLNKASISLSCSDVAGVSFAGRAIFAGGIKPQTATSNGSSNYVDSWDSDLVKRTLGLLGSPRGCIAAVVVGDNVLLGGGKNTIGGYFADVDVFNSDFVKQSTISLSRSVYGSKAVNVGDYAVFAGGSDGIQCVSDVEVFDSNLVRSSAASLSEAKINHACASAEGVAVFAGGSLGNANTVTDSVDIYNSSLVRNVGKPLSEKKDNMTVAVIGRYMLFAGGRGNNDGADKYLDTAEVYKYK